ncbi:hypothetical protein [Roseinatronobacter sp.]|uniref:hypothetical protein n=1 Tax=Roseinatronobacter sp. TaxID=1945755 RepID=UPI003F72A70B
MFSRCATEGTGRVQAQELGAQGFPLAGIAALATVRALGIMAAATGADGGALTLAAHISRNNLAT